MNSFFALSRRERDAAIEEAGQVKGITNPVLIEKDLWVCWVLRELFPEVPDDDGADAPLVFKGGTSLSKAYGAIERFSEDVDVTIRRSVLGAADLPQRVQAMSKRGRMRALRDLATERDEFVSQVLLPQLEAALDRVPLRDYDGSRSVELASADGDIVVLVRYPRTLTAAAYGEGAYVAPAVRVEIGARGDPAPAERKLVTPYVAEVFPQLFSLVATTVEVLSVLRTFWEKATLLHALAYKNVVPSRANLSRHLYDLFRLDELGFADTAIRDTQLLEAVARNKRWFFTDPQARYDLAAPGTFRLLPERDVLRALQADYEAMSEMIWGEIPSFDNLVERIRSLEERINNA